MTGIYQPPDPPIGPDRQPNASPFTDRAEVRAAREWLYVGPPQMWCWQDPELWPLQRDLGPEQFASHEEYVAAAHEIWGDDL